LLLWNICLFVEGSSSSKMIGDLPRGARGRRDKAGVKLPHYGGFVAGEEDEEEEEI
jgi:hypothetical protein